MAFFEEKSGLFKGFDQFSEEIWIKGGCVYVEGGRRLIAFSDTEISVRRKREVVTVKGEGLEISSFSKGELAVEGKISAVEISVI